MTSSRTSASDASSATAPSRTVRTLAAESSVSFSMVRLDRSCWTMPMTALAATIKRKVMSFQSPTSSRHTASTTKIRLKYVSRFSRTICLSDLVGEATDRLSQPASANAFAWAEVRPLSAVGCSRGISRRPGAAVSCGCSLWIHFTGGFPPFDHF